MKNEREYIHEVREIPKTVMVRETVCTGVVYRVNPVEDRSKDIMAPPADKQYRNPGKVRETAALLLDHLAWHKQTEGDAYWSDVYLRLLHIASNMEKLRP